MYLILSPVSILACIAESICRVPAPYIESRDLLDQPRSKYCLPSINAIGFLTWVVSYSFNAVQICCHHLSLGSVRHEHMILVSLTLPLRGVASSGVGVLSVGISFHLSYCIFQQGPKSP